MAAGTATPGRGATSSTTDEYVDVDTARTMLGGVSRTFVYRLGHSGEVGMIEAGRRRVFDAVDLRAWREAHRKGGRRA